MTMFLRLLGFCLLAPLAPAQNLFVDDDAPGPGTGAPHDPFPGIQEALSNPICTPGSTIIVLPGEYTGFHVVTTNVSIVAPAGPMRTIVRAAGPSPHASIAGLSAPCFLEGLWLRGVPGSHSGVGITVATGVQGGIHRCVLSDLGTGFANNYDLFVSDSAVIRCDLAYRGCPQDISWFSNTVLWNNAGFAAGSLTGQPTVNHCFFGDPLTFGANDFHLRRVSPCIDAGVGLVDPDGSERDIGPYVYDWNYHLGESFCFNAENSTGQQGRVQLIGTASLSSISQGEHLSLSVTRCPPGACGIFVVGASFSEIRLAASATMCVGAPLGSIGPVILDGAGAGQEMWLDAANISGLLPGDRRSVQFWHRDSTPGGMGLTHSVRMELLP